MPTDVDQRTLNIRVYELAAYGDCDACIRKVWRDGEALVAADHWGKRSRTRPKANRAFAGLRSEAVYHALPAGQFGDRMMRLTTLPFRVPRHPVPVVLSGELPVPLKLDGGGFAICRPTAARNSEQMRRSASRQLHAYARLAESPKNPKRALTPVNGLWVVWCAQIGDSLSVRACEQIRRDDDWFMADLGRIADIVRSPYSLPPSPKCSRCA